MALKNIYNLVPSNIYCHSQRGVTELDNSMHNKSRWMVIMDEAPHLCILETLLNFECPMWVVVPIQFFVLTHGEVQSLIHGSNRTLLLT